MSNHYDWLKQRRAIEGQREGYRRRQIMPDMGASSSVDCIVSEEGVDSYEHEDCTREPKDDEATLIPGPYDIICGRDKLAQNHKGNFRYQHVVESFREEYENSTKDEKTVVASKIVELVKRQGRFLKYEEATGRWVELTDKQARNKVSNAFRSRRKAVVRSVAASEQSVTDSSSRGERRARTSCDDTISSNSTDTSSLQAPMPTSGDFDSFTMDAESKRQRLAPANRS